MGCVFCRIAAKEVPAKVVLEDDEVIAFEDMDPRAPLHVLVIPKRHVESLAVADDPLLVGKVALAAARVAKDAGHAESGFRVTTNTGPNAGQTVPHLHLHVLAGRQMGWPAG